MELRFLRGFTLVVNDSAALSLEIEEMKLPTLEEKSLDFTPGGGNGETNISLAVTNKLEMPFKLATHNPNVDGLFGKPPGERDSFTGVKSLFDDVTGRAIETTVDVKARLMKVEAAQMKGGDHAGYDYTLSSMTWYSETQDGVLIRQFNFMAGGWTILNGKPVHGDHRRFMRF